MNSAAPAIEVVGLVKSFEKGLIVAIDGADISIAEGEFVAIMGPSGCGKSTLLHLIAALDKPDSGTIRINGTGLMSRNNLSRFRSHEVGLIFQLDNLLPTLSASENVQMPMFELGISAKERRKRAEHLLAMVGLAGKEKQRPTDLSGGERQRVAIARALANEPSILLADEPTGRLDSESGGRVLDLLDELREKRGLTIVIVTHDSDVAKRASRIVRMLDGRVIREEKVRA